MEIHPINMANTEGETNMITGPSNQDPDQVNNAQIPPLPPTEDILPKIWTELHGLNQKFELFSSQHTEVREHLYGEDGILKAVTDFGFVSNDIPCVIEDNRALRKDMNLLKAIVVKQSEQITKLQSKVTDLTARSMQENLLIHNVQETLTENIENIVKDLITKIGINADTVSIEKAHRVGPRNKDRPRLIVVKLASFKCKEIVLKAAKDKLPRGRDKIFITPQSPTESLETRRNLYSVADIFKEKDSTVKCVVKSDRLFVNNTLYRPALATPTTRDVLSLSRQDTEDLAERIKVYPGKPVVRQGNRFQGFAIPISSMEDAKAAYRAVMLYPDNQSAHHVIACATLYSPFTGKLEQHWEDNFEWGAGKSLAAHLVQRGVKNMVIFVARHYVSNLSKERFAAIKDAADDALVQYTAATK